jgi:hypothetical protein
VCFVALKLILWCGWSVLFMGDIIMCWFSMTLNWNLCDRTVNVEPHGVPNSFFCGVYNCQQNLSLWCGVVGRRDIVMGYLWDRTYQFGIQCHLKHIFMVCFIVIGL